MAHAKKKRVQLVNLSPEEVRKLLRPPTGFEGFVDEMVELYEKKTDMLRVQAFKPETVLTELASHDELLAMESAALAQYALVHKTRMLRASNAWHGVLQIYARAVSAARSDPEIKRAIARFQQFMKHGPRKKVSA